MYDQSSFINASISSAPSCPSIVTDNLSFVCSSFSIKSFNLLKQFLTFLLKIFTSPSSYSASLMRLFSFSSSFSSKFSYLVLFPFKNEDFMLPAMVFPFCVIHSDSRVPAPNYVVKHLRTQKSLPYFTVSHQYCQIKYIIKLFSATNILKLWILVSKLCVENFLLRRLSLNCPFIINILILCLCTTVFHCY